MSYIQPESSCRRSFPKNIPKFEFYKISYNSALMPLNSMPYIVNLCNELQKYLLPTKFQLILKMFVCGDSNSKF